MQILQSPTDPFQCNSGNIQKYLHKISGPLFDRIDIQLEVVPVPYRDLRDQSSAESSNSIRERVVIARRKQELRFNAAKGVYCNTQMNPRQMRQFCKLNEASQLLLKNAMDKLGLSARAYSFFLILTNSKTDTIFYHLSSNLL
ncbi:MAG: ATP-binding protein [Bacteroidota bacterium]